MRMEEDCNSSSAREVGSSAETISSRKRIPAIRQSSHPRIDQEEKLRLLMRRTAGSA